MTPLSKEEIKSFKELPLKEYVSFPLIYQREITDIFFSVFPRLIEIAEDHIFVTNRLRVIEENKLECEISKTQIIENSLIQALEMDITEFRSYYDRKYKKPQNTFVPWYKRLFRKIMGSKYD